MEVDDYEVVKRREQSSMMSTWTEYLCLTRKTSTVFELSILGYEVLGKISEYMDDEGEVNLPDEIDGKPVVGREDEYVVGGILVPHSDDHGTVEFTDPKHTGVSDWLTHVDWNYHETKKEIINLWKLSLDGN